MGFCFKKLTFQGIPLGSPYEPSQHPWGEFKNAFRSQIEFISQTLADSDSLNHALEGLQSGFLIQNFTF